ncbi:MAG: hypothetical protein FJ240_12440 [Nitrospira sp.]|nr:hypothetical protein [Nitrospira sp.]
MGERTDALFRNQLPADASVIKKIDSWAIFFSKSTSSLYVMTTEYHAGPLKLSMEELTELSGILKTHRDEMEKEIVKDLENHLANIVEKEEYKEFFNGSKIKLILPGE